METKTLTPTTTTTTTTTATTTDALRAVLVAMPEGERLRRFRELKQVVARQGGILLDPNQTRELVALGRSLGIEVAVERVDLPRPAPRTAPQADARPTPKPRAKGPEPQQAPTFFPTD